MSSDVSDSGSIQHGNMLAAVSLSAGRRSPVQSSPDRLRQKIASLEESVTALQSDLTAAHKLNHDLVCNLLCSLCWGNCTVLYCTALHCTVLYCTVLYCTVHKRSLDRPTWIG